MGNFQPLLVTSVVIWMKSLAVVVGHFTPGKEIRRGEGSVPSRLLLKLQPVEEVAGLNPCRLDRRPDGRQVRLLISVRREDD